MIKWKSLIIIAEFMNDDDKTKTMVPEDMNQDNTEDTNETMVTENVSTDEADKVKDDKSTVVSIPNNWIELIDGKFKCSECENENVPETNTAEGTVVADLEQIKADLKQFPTKVIYGICPVCGMEFVFRLVNDKLYLEPSELMK